MSGNMSFTNYVAKIPFWHSSIWTLLVYFVYCYRVYFLNMTLSGFFFFVSIMLKILYTVSLLTLTYGGQNKNCYCVLGREGRQTKNHVELFKDTEILNKFCSEYRVIGKKGAMYTILSLPLYPLSIAIHVMPDMPS